MGEFEEHTGDAAPRGNGTDGRHLVAVLALPGFPPFELGIPSRVFGSAVDDDGEELYEVVVCTADGAPVPSDSGFTLQPAAGLLDDRPATTHWNLAEEFRRAYPRVRIDEDVLFVDDGDVLTSAGVSAGVDLCLHLIRRDHGVAVTNRAARMCVVPPWRDGGQAQFIDRPVPEPTVATTTATRAWALERLAEPVSLAELAAHARMSLRTFTRRFRDEVGMTPVQWLTAQRLETARHLLESSDLPVDLVAHRSGFGSANSLRQHMRASLGVSPIAYRRTFQPAAPA
ncbi:GlxA family transcriptional regulator [Streptomyces sp. WAC05950]|uniref:GlxA family transcriptional regulator n=1 Tax=Streptomyces sp. WAC05950 TaxID=2487419 RepID=UPI0011E4D2D5|nr:helix-turn-helix domain-containing protein [Streptomyces sp. WAC05950]